MTSMMDYFSLIPDPRIERQKKHKLIDVLVVAVCGMICRCCNWVEIEEWGNANLDFLKKFLELKNNIPSHDTFGRIFSILDSSALEETFYKWSSSLANISDESVVAIDGKFFKASLETPYDKKSIIGTVNAWVTESGLSLIHKKIQQRTNSEQNVFLELLDALVLKGIIITMDANGCHARVTKKIIEKNGDYCLSLKGNQSSLLRIAKNSFDGAGKIKKYEVFEKGHGREEHRICESVNINDSFKLSLQKREVQRHLERWYGLKSVVRVTTNTVRDGRLMSDERYYISSLESNAEKQLRVIRSHWSVENNLHRTMDLYFDEDRSRARKGMSAENMAMIRKISLNLLNQDKSIKKSINVKRLWATAKEDYLLSIIREGGSCPGNRSFPKVKAHVF